MSATKQALGALTTANAKIARTIRLVKVLAEKKVFLCLKEIKND